MPSTEPVLFRYVPTRSRRDGRRRLPSAAQWLAVAALPLLAAAWVGAAHGQTLTVQANVAGSCSAQSGTLNFGQYVSGQSAPLRNTDASFSVSCPDGVGVTIKLGPGGNSSGTDRRMTKDGGSGVLRYNLYRDSQFSQVWGDGSFGQAKTIASFSSSGDGLQVVRGEVPAGQTVSPGAYSDQVTITVELNQ